MRKRICFTLDTKSDKTVLDMLELIPQCMRGSFIKVAILMDIDPEKDKGIFQRYPNFLNNPFRYEIVKSLLMKTPTGDLDIVETPDKKGKDEKPQWEAPAYELPVSK